ncbi:MAG: hypothetical protein LBE12_04950 [Planctomycetaceae bacterium]|jgi:F0F1-type ATP synthase alpha subunit|nr:hypothetical protein [Planctomycetaceae bacterium]
MGLLGLLGQRNGHKPLFDDLCQYHKLDRKIKLLLNRIIQKYQLLQPVDIFIDSTLLDRALNDEEFTESADDLRELIKIWFES